MDPESLKNRPVLNCMHHRASMWNSTQKDSKIRDSCLQPPMAIFSWRKAKRARCGFCAIQKGKENRISMSSSRAVWICHLAWRSILPGLNRNTSAGAKKTFRPPGRPPVPQNVEELILRMAKENGWGYARIQGELKKLGITVAANTIKKILIKNGFHPSPNRTKGDWDRFIKRHIDTLWACDFFSKDVWTACGKVTYYVLFFIHVGTRRVHISGMTCQPNGPWVEQQARNLVMDLAERGEKASYLIKDDDTKFTQKFDEVFRSEGFKVKKLPFASPNLNAFAERFVQSIKNECIDQFVIFGERHLEFLVREYERHYNTVRPHQGLGNKPIGVVAISPPKARLPDASEVECDSRLGGVLRHYYRKAA